MSVASERANATARVAGHVASLRFEMLEPETVAHAKAAVLDVIGIALRAGTDADSTPALTRAVDALDAGGPARVIGSDRGYQPQHAALLNATYAHTLDFDDTHVGGSIHPGAPTIPAVLAVAETERRSGRALLAAIVAGYDVCVRLSEALTPAAQYDRGFHPSATCGAFGAAAAVANLSGDDAAMTANAFGVVLSAAAGSMQYLENGSWNKRFHVGFAAYNGIVAERFARAGVVGAADALDGRFGLRHSYAGGGSFDGIEAAFSRVKSSAERVIAGDEAAKDQSFEDIFALNNEVGRLARERPETMPKMKELQAYVNMITVGIKYGGTAGVREGLSIAEETIKALQKEIPPSP